MYEFLKHAHSGWRWIVLATLIAAIIHALVNWRSGKMYNFKDRKPALYALIASHIQLVVGLILYFFSPMVQFSSNTMSNSLLRFYTVEHLMVMIIGVVLITIGFAKAKRKLDTNQGYKTIFIYYLIALILILSRIPWPFQDYAAGWF